MNLSDLTVNRGGGGGSSNNKEHSKTKDSFKKRKEIQRSKEKNMDPRAKAHWWRYDARACASTGISIRETIALDCCLSWFVQAADAEDWRSSQNDDYTGFDIMFNLFTFFCA